jgi:hypothetical protein
MYWIPTTYYFSGSVGVPLNLLSAPASTLTISNIWCGFEELENIQRIAATTLNNDKQLAYISNDQRKVTIDDIIEKWSESSGAWELSIEEHAFKRSAAGLKQTWQSWQ